MERNRQKREMIDIVDEYGVKWIVNVSWRKIDMTEIKLDKHVSFTALVVEIGKIAAHIMTLGFISKAPSLKSYLSRKCHMCLSCKVGGWNEYLFALRHIRFIYILSTVKNQKNIVKNSNFDLTWR